jgi:hypothetical protein
LSKLQSIAARYSAALGAAQTLDPLSDDEKLNVLRCIMRFGLAWNRLATEVKLGGKDRDAYSDDEWRAYIADSASYFNSHLRDFGSEEGCIGYIVYWMGWMFPELKRENPYATLWPDKLDISETPKIIEWFISQPDAANYGYRA